MVFALARKRTRKRTRERTADVAVSCQPLSRLSTELLVRKHIVRLLAAIIALIGFAAPSFALGEAGQGEVSKSSALGSMQIGSSEFMTADDEADIVGDIAGEDSVIIIAYQHSDDPDAEWEELLISESEYVKFLEEEERQKRNLILGSILGATSAIAIYCIATRDNNNSSDGCNTQGVVMSGIGGLFVGGVLGSSL